MTVGYLYRDNKYQILIVGNSDFWTLSWKLSHKTHKTLVLSFVCVVGITRVTPRLGDLSDRGGLGS